MTALDNISARVQRVRAALFTEDGAGTYEWSVTIPAYAIISNIGVHAAAVWDAGTAASLEVGLTGDDDDTFFTAIDLKATDLTANQSVDFAKTGGVEGASASGSASHWDDRYSTSARTLSFTATATGTDGSAGRTVCWVEYLVPVLETPTFA